MKRTLALIAAAFALALTGCSSSPKPGGTINLNLGGAPATRAEAEDATVLAAATQDYSTRGYAGLAPHLPKLRAALDRAPASYPLIDKLADGSFVVRTNDESEGMMLMILVAAMPVDRSQNASVSQSPNVYGMIAMILGSDAVERKNYAEAHGYLDRGLALQPENWSLLTEKAAAFIGERKWTDALAIADQALDSGDMIIGMHRGAFLRKRGFALVELGRLVEAREAYVEALKEDEKDEIARGEIDYIDGLLNGGKPTAPIMKSDGSPQ